MSYTDVIKVSPEVMKELRRLKAEYGLQSHNKVLRRVLGLTPPESAPVAAEGHSCAPGDCLCEDYAKEAERLAFGHHEPD